MNTKMPFRTNFSNYDAETVVQFCQTFVNVWHSGSNTNLPIRRGYEPYVTHCINVAGIASDLYRDHFSHVKFEGLDIKKIIICAGLLHDVLEKTKAKRDILITNLTMMRASSDTNASEFVSTIIAAVDLLTDQDKLDPNYLSTNIRTYDSYLERLNDAIQTPAGFAASVVKAADALDNSVFGDEDKAFYSANMKEFWQDAEGRYTKKYTNVLKLLLSTYGDSEEC